MICAICDREILEDPGEQDWRGKNLAMPDLCVGCWMAWVDVTQFIIRAGRHQPWSLDTYQLMRELLGKLNMEEE